MLVSAPKFIQMLSMVLRTMLRDLHTGHKTQLIRLLTLKIG
jgi:hypothetical protein